MQQQDAKHQQQASEFMRDLLGMSRNEYDAMAKEANKPKPLPKLEETLVERVQRLKAERNTIAQQKK